MENETVRKTYTRLFVAFLLANLLLFQIYRVVFMLRFAGPMPLAAWPKILLYALRLDLPLIGVELLLYCATVIPLSRFMKVSRTLPLAMVTGFHFAFCCVDILFFVERNQHVAEMLVAFATDPYQMYLAVGPFIEANPLTTVGITAVFLLFIVGGVMAGKSRRGPAWLLDDRRTILGAVLIALLFALPVFEPVRVKYTINGVGWQLKFLRGQYYLRFPDYVTNQAVLNPIYELAFVQIPSAFYESVPYRVPEVEAMATCRSLLDLEVHNPDRYPLLRKINSKLDLGLKNVVIIEVEGLSGWVVDHEVKGVAVTPFVRELGREGLRFTNTFQSFNATVGSVFATASSVHKNCFDEKTKRLTTFENQGYYGSLARILDSPTYSHYFFEGFRQNAPEFASFMGNQGFKAYCYEDLHARLAKKDMAKIADGELGIYDEYLFKEAAEVILASPTESFSAHLMTGTSHSPWRLPKDHRGPFDEASLNAFAYVDQCIKQFIDTFRQRPEVFDRTLFVIVADHTSITFDKNMAEYIRIPLIFYSPRLAEAKDHLTYSPKTYASHVDIQPTILDLLGGEHDYAGMGESLMSPTGHRKGAISGRPGAGVYVKGSWMMAYDSFANDVNLYQFDGEKVDLEDVSAKYPDVSQSLFTEYLAQFETARRLAFNRNIFPVRTPQVAAQPAAAR